MQSLWLDSRRRPRRQSNARPAAPPPIGSGRWIRRKSALPPANWLPVAIVGQGYDTRSRNARIRLLAFVDASFFSPYIEPHGKRYRLATGDAQWFSDNIP